MTEQDFAIIIKYLEKSAVPPADQDSFLRAFERLISLRNKAFSGVTALR